MINANNVYFNFVTIPEPFNKSLPVNNSIGQSTSPTLSWTPSIGAISYFYCYDKTNDNVCTTWVSNGTSTSKVLSGLAQNTTYYWQVRAVNPIGMTYANGSATSYWSFKTGSMPAAFLKTSPATGAINRPVSPTLKWGASSGATSYEYCYDTTNDSACNTNWVSNGVTTSVVLNNLLPSTTYYWQVRAVSAVGTTYANGSATSYWKFTTGVLPGTLNKSGPADGAVDQPVSLTLSWSASTGAASYWYCYDTSNDNACTTWVSNGTATSKVLSGLEGNTIYYWQVRATNTIGSTFANASSTDYWSFKTGTLPGTLNKISPTSGVTGQPFSLTLNWEASTDAVSYEYCYDKTNDNACTGWLSNGTSTSKVLSGLSANTIYYWQVRAVNAVGTTYANGSATSFWNFKTGVLPGAFMKTSPPTASINQPGNPTLKWATSLGVAYYEYCYDTTNDNTCTTWVNNGTSTIVVLTNLAPSTAYYWQVRAVSAVGNTYANGSITSFWNFTTEVLPGVMNKIRPSNSSTSLPTSLILSWTSSSGATSYWYCYDTTNDNACTNWVNNGAATSVGLRNLALSTTFYWQVRANNSVGSTYANGSDTNYWKFTTGNYVTIPGEFFKISPRNSSASLPTSLTLSWTASSGATSYWYCIDTSNDNACTTWVSNGTATSKVISGLAPNTTYYWQVRATNAIISTYANGSSTNFWSFKTNP